MGITAMTLNALIRLDDSEFRKGLSGAEEKCKGFGDKVSKLGNGIVKLGKTAGAVVGAASVAVGKLALDSVQAYSEYEQLVGGVETLFGTASDKVMEYAHSAFKRAGVDANTYMETVTSFSASLLQSLGGDTDRAAKVADMAMVDMADNANKMGTDMSAIQNAYQGFAKQNYTMLDNLKLGYGGTRTEMERLLKDAEKIQRKQGNIVSYSIDNLSDVYEAIHVVQTELGITGTTAEEADSTIQGSTARMKAAWNNLKIAMVDPNANIGQAITDMIDSAKIAIKNFAPAFKNALTGIGQAIVEIAPVLSEELPSLITEILPGLVSAGVEICKALATAIVDNASVIIDGIGQVFQAVGTALQNSDSEIFQAVGSVLTFIGNLIRDPEGTIAQAWTDLQTWLEGAWEGVATWFDTNVWKPIADFFDERWKEIEKLWTGVKELISGTWSTIAKWFDDTVWQPLKSFFEPVWEFISQLWDGISSTISQAWEDVKTALDPIIKPIKELFQGVVDVVSKIWDTLSNIFGLGDKNITIGVDYVQNADPSSLDPSLNWTPSYQNDLGGGNGESTDTNDWRPSYMHSKGSWAIPFDNYPALLHRGEMVLTASQARRVRDGNSGIDFRAMTGAIVEAVRDGMDGVSVNSFLNGREITDDVNRDTVRQLKARRFRG